MNIDEDASDPLADTTSESSSLGAKMCDLAFKQYSDAELAVLITSLQKFDQDRFLNAAHSAAVVD